MFFPNRITYRANKEQMKLRLVDDLKSIDIDGAFDIKPYGEGIAVFLHKSYSLLEPLESIVLPTFDIRTSSMWPVQYRFRYQDVEQFGDTLVLGSLANLPDGAVPRRNQQGSFVSPPVKLAQGPACLSLRWICRTSIKVTVIFDRKERVVVLEKNHPFGDTWIVHHFQIDAHSEHSHAQLEFVADTLGPARPVAFALNHVELRSGSCTETLPIGTVTCDFSKDCGYMDESPGTDRWLTVIPVRNGKNLQMEAQLTGVDSTSAVLVSPVFALNQTGCLSISYRLSTRDLELNVSRRYIENQKPIEQFSLEAVYNDWATVSWMLSPSDLPSQMVFTGQKLKSKSDVQYRFIQLDDIVLDTNISNCQQHNFSNDINVTTKTENGDTKAEVNQSMEGMYSRLLEDIKDYKVDNLDRILGQGKSSLIHECMFMGEACNISDNISPTFTDHGFCYSFNMQRDRVLLSNKTGALSGLRLKLNIEQYENVDGFSAIAGLKIHLHSQNDLPQIKQLGFAVAPGEHTLVSFSYQHSTSLEDPWGKCVKMELELFPGENYTQHRCVVQNQVRSLQNLCGCKDDWMPGPYNICGIHEYLDCLRYYRSGAIVGSSDFDEQCPDACDVEVFLSTISKALISDLGVDKYLSHRKSELTTGHLLAFELRQRVTADLMESLIQSIAVISEQRDEMEALVELKLVNERTSISHRVEKGVKELELISLDSWNSLMSNVSEYQQHYRNNIEFLYRGLENRVGRLIADISVCRYSLQEMDINETLNRQDKLEWLKSLSDEVVLSASKVIPLLKAGVDLSKIEDKYLPNFTVSTRGKRYHCRVSKSTIIYEIEHESLPVFRNLSQTIHQILTDIHSNNLSASNTKLDHSVSMVLEIGMGANLMHSVKTLESCYNEYEHFLDEIANWMNADNAIEQPSTDTDFVDILYTLASDREVIDEMLNNFTSNRITKYKMAEFVEEHLAVYIPQHSDAILSKARSSVINPLQAYLANTQDKLMQSWNTSLIYYLQLQSYFSEKFSTGNVRALSIWRNPYPNLDLAKVISYELAEEEIDTVWPPDIDFATFLVSSKGSSKLSIIIGDYFSVLKKEVNDLDSELKQMKSSYINTFNKFVQELIEYKANIDRKDQFVTDNFVSVDIYYGELKYEEIEQLKAYDILAFFSDVGGFMGLLLGCSVITVFEVLDLVLFYSAVRCTTQQKRTSTVEPNNNPTL